MPNEKNANKTVSDLHDSRGSAQPPDGGPSDTESASPAALPYPGPGKLFIIWTVAGILVSLRGQFVPSKPEIGQLALMLAFAASYYPWIALSPLVFRMERRFPLGSSGWVRNLGILAGLSLPLCLLASPVIVWLFFAGMSVLGPTPVLRGRPFIWLSHFPSAQVVFWCSVAGGYFVRTLNQMREQERRAARLVLEKSQLETGLKQAQLDALRARLNPHFLFNSLQNISVMAKQDPQTASRMLTRLGDLLRAVLQHDSGPEHPLRDEIDLTQAYVALEQMRFGDRLTVNFSIAPEVQMAMVPCFILQPLIENAVIHGLRGVRKTGVIAVTAAQESNELVLIITDNGNGLPDQDFTKIKIGVGVGSTRERLSTMYPGRHTFSMRKPPDGGTEVRIVIPLHFADFEEGASPDEQPAVAGR